MLVGVVYRPNNSVDTYPFLSVIESLCPFFENIVICGDSNSNILVQRYFLEEMTSLGMYIVNKTVNTHFTATSSGLLDFFFIDKHSKNLLYNQISCSNFSKHDLIFLTCDFICNRVQQSFS